MKQYPLGMLFAAAVALVPSQGFAAKFKVTPKQKKQLQDFANNKLLGKVSNQIDNETPTSMEGSTIALKVGQGDTNQSVVFDTTRFPTGGGTQLTDLNVGGKIKANWGESPSAITGIVDHLIVKVPDLGPGGYTLSSSTAEPVGMTSHIQNEGYVDSATGQRSFMFKKYRGRDTVNVSPIKVVVSHSSGKKATFTAVQVETFQPRAQQ